MSMATVLRVSISTLETRNFTNFQATFQKFKKHTKPYANRGSSKDKGENVPFPMRENDGERSTAMARMAIANHLVKKIEKLLPHAHGSQTTVLGLPAPELASTFESEQPGVLEFQEGLVGSQPSISIDGHDSAALDGPTIALVKILPFP